MRTVALDLSGTIDVAAERKRLAKDLAAAEKEKAQAHGKLGNEAFLAKAPDHVVDKIRTRLAKADEDIARIQAQLERLPAGVAWRGGVCSSSPTAPDPSRSGGSAPGPRFGADRPRPQTPDGLRFQRRVGAGLWGGAPAPRDCAGAEGAKPSRRPRPPAPAPVAAPP